MKYLAILLLLTGCSATTTVELTMPPNVGVLNVETVAVGEFTGSHGDEFAAGLAQTLEGLSYTLADGGASFTGDAEVKVRTAYFYINESVCNDKDDCYTYEMRCTRGWYDMTVSIELRGLYTRGFTRGIRSESCPSDPSYDTEYRIGFLGSKVQLGEQTAQREMGDIASEPIARMQDNILLEIAEDLGEYRLSVKVKLAGEDKSLSAADAERFKAAVDLAKADDINAACAIWADLERSNQSSSQAPYLLYNLGVCRETVGDESGARDYFMRADAVLGDDELISMGLARVRLAF